MGSSDELSLVDGVLVEDGPITAVTDVYGRYRMEAFYAGKYKVVFTRPNGHAPTLPGADQDPTASHIVVGDAAAASHETNVFQVNTTNYRYTRNAGYVYALGDLKITKQLQNSNGNTIAQGNRDFMYQVMVDGAPYANAEGLEIHALVQGVLEVSRAPLDDQVRFTMKNGNTAWIRGLSEGTAYTVTEIDANLYESTPTSGSYTGAVQVNENTLAFINKETNNGVLSVTKSLVDSNGNVLDETGDTREFYFRAFGPSFTGTTTTGGVTFSLKAGETYKLENLAYGRYYVYEQADSNYNRIMPTTDYTIQYTYNTGTLSSYGSQDVQFANRTPTIIVKNTERPLGKLQIFKSLFDNADNRLMQSRYFQYRLTGPTYPNGYTFGFYTNTINNPNRIANYISLKYGEYTLEEVDYAGAHDKYDITYVHDDGQGNADSVTSTQTLASFALTFDNRAVTQSVEIQNKEKALGELTVLKHMRNAAGAYLNTDTRTFEVTISGDNLPADYANKTLTVSATTPAVFRDLPYGTYTVSETADERFYTTTYSPTSASQTLTMATPKATVTITNYEKPAGEIRLVKNVLAADGSQINDGRSFWVRVSGPAPYTNVRGTYEVKNLVDENGVDVVSSATTKAFFGTYTLEEIAVDGG